MCEIIQKESLQNWVIFSELVVCLPIGNSIFLTSVPNMSNDLDFSDFILDVKPSEYFFRLDHEKYFVILRSQKIRIILKMVD